MKFKDIQKNWLLFWKFRKLRLMTMMEYRGDFIFWTFVSTMWTAFNFFIFGIIVNATGTIGGWSRSDMFVLLSTNTMIDAFLWSFVYHNMREYTNSVFTGSFSTFLTKPVDTQFLMSIKENSYTNVFRFFVGIGMLIWSINMGNYQLTILNVALYIFFVACSFLFLQSLWFLLATFSFWAERLDNLNEIIPSVDRTWKVPRTVYTGVSSTIFTVLIPLGLITSLPSEIILGKAAYGWCFFFFLFTIALTILGRKFFYYSIRKYSSVGQ